MIKITDEWLNEWKEVKDVLVPYSDISKCFYESEIGGYEFSTLEIGTVKFPTGKFFVLDPLVWLPNEGQNYYMREVPTGEYPLSIAVVKVEEDHYRYAVARVLFSDNPVKSYEEALKGDEKFEGVAPGMSFGFEVDAGLATITDAKTRDNYIEFYDQWYMQNPDGNIYDDYFAKIFSESYEKQPKFQREGGDWINWTIPNTDFSIPMFQSGFGDGTYPVYFGLDENGDVCQLLIEFIDVQYIVDHQDE